MLSYYFHLPKGRKRLDFDTNHRRSTAIFTTAKAAFEPFEAYLDNAIQAFEKKSDVKAKWKKVDLENMAELQLVGGLYEVSKQTFVEFEEGALSDAEIGDVINGSAGQHRIETIHKDGFVLDVLPDVDELLFWNKKRVDFSIVHSEKPEGTIIHESSTAACAGALWWGLLHPIDSTYRQRRLHRSPVREPHHSAPTKPWKRTLMDKAGRGAVKLTSAGSCSAQDGGDRSRAG